MVNNRSYIDDDVLHYIDEAEKIIFLGFGYDEDNLELLQVKDKAKTIKSLGAATEDIDYPIIGTAYGLGKAQYRDAISEFNSKLRLGSKELTCVPFCNEWVSVKSI